MLVLMIAFVGLVFTAVRYTDLPIGRALHEALIAAPAAWLAKTRPQRIVIILVLLLCLYLLWNELVPLLMAADYAPVLWFADLSIYLDAVLTAAAVAATVRAKAIGALTSGVLRMAFRSARPRRRARSSRPRRAKRPPPADEDAPGFAFSIAA